jgi:hypothetical protein
MEILNETLSAKHLWKKKGEKNKRRRINRIRNTNHLVEKKTIKKLTK